MKKSGILNPHLLYELGCLGHRDVFVVADAGLPIPREIQRVDLSLVPGIPAFLDVLEAVLKEVVVEEAIVAKEMSERSPRMYEAVAKLLKEIQGLSPGHGIIMVDHEVFKEKYVRSARFVIRTGEFTPYSNIALVSGVPF